MSQLEIGFAPLTRREKALAEFKVNHPFLFHRLIVKNGIASHHNSLYRDYNCTDWDLEECDMQFTKRIICNSLSSIRDAISNPPIKGNQTLYILTNIDWTVLKGLGELIKD